LIIVYGISYRPTKKGSGGAKKMYVRKEEKRGQLFPRSSGFLSGAKPHRQASGSVLRGLVRVRKSCMSESQKKTKVRREKEEVEQVSEGPRDEKHTPRRRGGID